jgi:hypothetical protein
MAVDDAATSSPSSINSVVTFLDQPVWSTLSKTHLLSQLHATYWGKKEEEHQEYDPNEDDDIIKGCHVLNIKNKAIKMGNNIWVRASVYCVLN